MRGAQRRTGFLDHAARGQLAGFSLDGVDLTQILAKDVVAGRPTSLRMPVALWAAAEPARGIARQFAPGGLGQLQRIHRSGDVRQRDTRRRREHRHSRESGDRSHDHALRSVHEPDDGYAAPRRVFTMADVLSGLCLRRHSRGRASTSEDQLQNLGPARTGADIHRRLNLRGDRAANTTVKFTLPPGFVYVPNTLKIDGRPRPTDAVNRGRDDAARDAEPGPRSPRSGRGRTDPRPRRPQTRAAPRPTDGHGGPEHRGCVGVEDRTVTESFENGGTPTCGDFDPCDTKTLLPNTLYVGHISTPTDKDVYTFSVPSTGKTRRRSFCRTCPPTSISSCTARGRDSIGARPPLESFQPVNDQA